MALPSAELRRLVREVVGNVWPAVDPRLIEAQMIVESGCCPEAVSPAGAVGLMQIMPATAAELGVDVHRLIEPQVNLQAGVEYLKRQFKYFDEIPSYYHRMCCALAAYNGGRGWVNLALKEARRRCGEPADLITAPAGAWQRWENIAGCLHLVRRSPGKRPDAAQIVSYVAKVRLMRWFMVKRDRETNWKG